jgi:hypothetical protein
MNPRPRNILVLIIIVLALVAVWFFFVNTSSTATPGGQQSGTNTSGQTTSDGTISFATPTDWGLATTKDQILTKSYIPPCDDQFNYCLYYNGTEFEGSNFGSAGLRIEKRTDLTTEHTCLQTSPEGFDSSVKPTSTTSGDGYSSSVFGNVGQGAAGHIAEGQLYRLFVRSNSSCYEFETRISQTQFANYPAGTIKQFTDAMQQAVQAQLTLMVQSISLPSGQKNLFPKI